MEIKNLFLGLGIIGAGVFGYSYLKNKNTENESFSSSSGFGGGSTGAPLGTTQLFDFSGLFQEDILQTPETAFSQTSSLTPETTKKDSSAGQGYISLGTGSVITDIFKPVATASPDRFAYNPNTGGIIDTARQQSVTPKELAKRQAGNIFEPASYYPTTNLNASTKKDEKQIFTNPNAQPTSNIKDLFTFKPVASGGGGGGAR